MNPQPDESDACNEETDFEARGQSEQDVDDLLNDRLPSESELCTSREASTSQAAPPSHDAFSSEQDFEEARSRWQSTVGRYRAIRGKSVS